MTVPYQNYASDTDTNFDNVLPAINSLIAGPGDGTSPSSPQKILFFVSDGVADARPAFARSRPARAGTRRPGRLYRCQEPLNVSSCTAMKARGIKIAVLYTTYLALPTNGWYMSWIDPFNKGPMGRRSTARSPRTCRAARRRASISRSARPTAYRRR